MVMNGISKAIFLWGVICLIGFGVYHFSLMDPNFPKPLPVWTVLAVIGIGAMIAWVPAWKKNKVVQVWIAVNVIGMAYHWAFATGMIPALIPNPWAYWAIVMGLGFLGTGYYWKSNPTFYYGLGVLHLVLFGILNFTNLIGFYGSALLAITSGLPLIYDGLKGQ